MSTEAPHSHGLLVHGAGDAADTPHPVPLTGVDVRARIAGSTARVRVIQRYRNDAATPVEATYVFPLEESSAVCGFRAHVDGALLEGRVESREKAFDEYDDAMAEGRVALLLDQERPDVFTASVGNLLPGQQIDVELDYVAEVPREGSALRWRLPTTVSPRYVPASRRNAEGMDDAERINPPVRDLPLDYRLSLMVDVDLGTPLRAVESPSHKTRMEMDGSRARIELTGDEGLMDRDFVLLLHPQDPVSPLSGIEVGPDGARYVGVSFLPEFERERVPVEVIFVVDCSGSMQGDSIEQARKTLRLCLRSLERGDHFNLIRFGSRFERLAEKSLAYDDDTLERADAHVRQMDADLGGTELAGPLTAAYALPALEGVSRRIVVITDGQVSNEAEVLDLARTHASDVSVFAFGVGYGASEHLVRGLARAGRGAAEMVYPGETIDDKVLRHFQRMTGRRLPDVQLTWEGLEVDDVVPQTTGPVWAGEPVSFYARVVGGARGRAVLTVPVDGETRHFVSALDPGNAEAMGEGEFQVATPILWARRRIQQLEESPLDGERLGSQQQGRTRERSERSRERTEQQLVELGRTFGLVSSATSYVLIDDREEARRAGMRARFVRVPGQLTRGWHRHLGTQFAGIPLSAMESRSSAAAFSLVDYLGRRERLESRCPERFRSRAAPSREEPRGRGGKARRDPMESLALQLSVDGAWSLSSEAERVTGLSVRRVRELAEDLPIAEAEALVVTLAVLVRLEARYPDVPERWKPLLEKARRWVERTVAGTKPPSQGSWEDWMRAQLGT